MSFTDLYNNTMSNISFRYLKKLYKAGKVCTMNIIFLCKSKLSLKNIFRWENWNPFQLLRLLLYYS